MTQPLSINDCVIEDCLKLVDEVTKKYPTEPIDGGKPIPKLRIVTRKVRQINLEAR